MPRSVGYETIPVADFSDVDRVITLQRLHATFVIGAAHRPSRSVHPGTSAVNPRLREKLAIAVGQHPDNGDAEKRSHDLQYTMKGSSVQVRRHAGIREGLRRGGCG